MNSSHHRTVSDVAVFARNYRKYLVGAAERNTARLDRFTTFRSSASWTSAQKTTSTRGPIPIYFVPTPSKGANPRIEFEAILHQVLLSPVVGESETEELLACELESTRNEGLWEDTGKPVQSLYAINYCRHLTNPFPMTDLIKLSDEKPISADFGYGYVLVHPREYLPKDSFDVHPEEILEPSRYKEGSTKEVSVNVYERSAPARRACVAHYGFNCSVCNMSFYEFYGDIGTEFIHVHHLKSLASVDDEYDVDPITDLRPVCPNCHAMLHRQNPPLAIDDLKLRLAQKNLNN